jgi:hypothetical protein
VYFETMLAPAGEGHPVECFIKDPPMLLDTQAIGLTPIGTKIISMNGVNHVFDWVGTSHYPNVADFVEEVRRFGASRRAAQNIDFSLLSPDSMLVLVHSRTVIDTVGTLGTRDANRSCALVPGAARCTVLPCWG